jgi:hypothetical protein
MSDCSAPQAFEATVRLGWGWVVAWGQGFTPPPLVACYEFGVCKFCYLVLPDSAQCAIGSSKTSTSHSLAPLKLLGQDRLPAMVHPASSTATFTLVRTALHAYSC